MKKMTKTAFTVLLCSFLFLLPSCETDKRTPQGYFEIINESGHEVFIVNESTYDYSNIFPKELNLNDNDAFSWKRIDHTARIPISAHYIYGDLIECWFDEEYHIAFMGDLPHKYNFAIATSYDVEGAPSHKRYYSFVISEEMYEYAKFLNEQGLVYAGSEEPGWVLPPQYEDMDPKKYKYILESAQIQGINIISKTVNEYDDQDRIINTKEYNKEKLRSEYYNYTYSGKSCIHFETHHPLNEDDKTTNFKVVTEFWDDNFEKKSSVKYTNEDDPSDFYEYKYEYDELGRLTGYESYSRGRPSMRYHDYTYDKRTLTYYSTTYSSHDGSVYQQSKIVENYLDYNYETVLDSTYYEDDEEYKKSVYKYNNNRLPTAYYYYSYRELSVEYSDYNYSDKALSYISRSYNTQTGEISNQYLIRNTYLY